MAWRALGTRVFTAAWGGLLPLGAVALFLANNTLTALQAGLAVRLGGGAALVLACANIAEPLAARRPAWPWSRSLPWSAARRVIFDACLIAVPALALVAITARLDSGAALPLAAIVPLVAFRSAGAMRRAPERGMGAAGDPLSWSA